MTQQTQAELPMVGRYRKKPVVIEAVQWFKNGDHPKDGDERFTQGEYAGERYEGKVVRYYRHPQVSGEKACEHCGRKMHDHGWIDTLEGGHIVCPGDFVITGVKGERYPCKPDIFAATYEARSEGKSGFDFRPSWLATAKHLREMLKGERHTEAVSDCRHCTIKYAAITLEELAAGKHFTNAVDAHAAMSTQAERPMVDGRKVEILAFENREAAEAFLRTIAPQAQSEGKQEFINWFIEGNHRAPAEVIADKAAEIFASTPDTTLRAVCERLPARVLEMCKARNWSLHWTCRGAYLHLETSELIEAVRGKRGNKRDEAADVLIVLMSITESQGIAWADVVAQASKRTEELLASADKPYAGEERELSAQGK